MLRLCQGRSTQLWLGTLYRIILDNLSSKCSLAIRIDVRRENTSFRRFGLEKSRRAERGFAPATELAFICGIVRR